MPKLICYIAASVDGYIARKGGAVDWLPEGEKDQDYGYAEFFATIGTVVYGAETYAFMRAHDMHAYEGVENMLFSRNYSGQLPPGMKQC